MSVAGIFHDFLRARRDDYIGDGVDAEVDELIVVLVQTEGDLGN